MKRRLIIGALALIAGLGGMQISFVGAVEPPTTRPGDPAEQPTTQPSTQPTTQPGGSPILSAMARFKESLGAAKPAEELEAEASDEDETQATASAEAPARPLDKQGKRIPSPAELMRQMNEAREAEAAKALVAHIDLSSPVMEQPTGFSLFGGSPGTDLRAVLSRLEQARQDESCHAVLLTFYNGGLMNMAQAQEIRRALDKLKQAGKRTFIYADTYDTVSYLVASAATDVCLMDGGEVFMPGIMIEPMFYRGTLDKLGIVPDYVQIGEYKGAEEPYTRTQPSPELAQEMEQLADAMHGEIVRQIARGRGISKEKVAALIDDAMIPAKKARMNGLVDHLVDADGLRVLMSESLGEEELRIDASYGSSQEEFDADNPFAMFAAMSQARQEVSTTGPSIGLVYAEGVITGGEGGSDGLFAEGGIGSERIRRAMRMAERDENIKAIVIRIDSPGGSALASEAMYQAVRRMAEKKPVIISVGNMAASGGYYLACAGDTIIADPSAIVGSIGVVGGKLVLEGLYEKLGLSTATFSRGANADIYSSTEPWSDEQRELIRKWMTSTYELFTERVMESRGRKITDIDAVARGRIFLARDARKLGMIDRLGGIEDAITLAAKRAELGEEYEVIVIPENQFNPFDQGGLSLPIGQAPTLQVNVKLSAEAAGLIELLPAHLREALSRTVQLSGLLDDRPVVLMTPYLIRVR